MSGEDQRKSRLEALIARVKGLLLSPEEEWPQICSEALPTQDILKTHVLPLAAVGPLAKFIGGQIFGYGILGFGAELNIAQALADLVSSYVFNLAAFILLVTITPTVAQRFGGKLDRPRTFALIAYSMTAYWLSGIFHLFPIFSVLLVLGLYSVHVFHVGAGVIAGVPEEKSMPFIAVILVFALILIIGTSMISGAVTRSFAPDPFDNDYALNGSASPAEPG